MKNLCKGKHIPLSTDQGIQGLSSLFDGLVESLRWAVAVLAEYLVLGEEKTLDSAHQLFVEDEHHP